MQFINQLKLQLDQPLPGKDAQSIMMIKPKPIFRNNTDIKTVKLSAVLILLFFENNNWNFFLTKRSQNVNHHKGQISLPGGAAENNELFEKTALRETFEEIGIPSDIINVIGALSSFHIPISGFEIFPFASPPAQYPDPFVIVKSLSK